MSLIANARVPILPSLDVQGGWATADTVPPVRATGGVNGRARFGAVLTVVLLMALAACGGRRQAPERVESPSDRPAPTTTEVSLAARN